MPDQILPITGIADVGVIKDTPAVSLPPNAFTDARNVRLHAGAVRKMEGEIDLLPQIDTDLLASGHVWGEVKYIAWWNSPNRAPLAGYMVVIAEELNAAGSLIGDRVILMDHNTSNDAARDITPATGLSANGRWQHTFFQGGFAIVLNNGVDAPVYLLDPAGTEDLLTETTRLAKLPGWDSYRVNDLILRDTFDAEADTRVFDTGRTIDYTTSNLVVQVGTDSEIILPSDTDIMGVTTSTDTDTNTTIVSFTEAALPDNSLASITVRSKNTVEVSAGVIRTFGDFLVAGNLTERDSVLSTRPIVRRLAGVVRSSDVAPPGSIPNNWNPYAAGVSTADDFVITADGVVTDMAELQGNFYIYSNSSISAMRQTGNTSVPLQVAPVTNSYGCQNTGSLVEVDGKHIVIGSQDIYVFPGHPANIQSIADGRVRHYFFENQNPLHERNTFIMRYPAEDEIWICFPTNSALVGECNEALIWNYRSNTWTIRDLNDVWAGDIAPVRGGGLPGTTITLTGSSGSAGYEFVGAREVQSLTVNGIAKARHSGIQHEERLLISPRSVVATPFVTSANEIFDLIVSGDAGPNTVNEVRTITLPDTEFTYAASTLYGGARLQFTDNTGTHSIAANDLSGLSGATTTAQLATAAVTYINNDSLPGFTWSASSSGRVITLTSDLPGPRSLGAASLNFYTGTTVSISGSDTESNDANSLTLVRTATSTSYSGVNVTGTVDSEVGGIAVTIETTGSTGQRNQRNYSYCGHAGTGSPLTTGTGSASQGYSSGSWIRTTQNGPGGSVSPNTSGNWQYRSSGGSISGSVGASMGDCGGFGWQITTAKRITFTNNNIFSVTLHSDSTGGARTIAPGASAMVQDYDDTNGRLADWRVRYDTGSYTTYNWTVTNNRSAATHNVAADVFDYTATVGTATLDFGNITAGSSATLNTANTTATATYAAFISGSTNQSFNQNLNDTDSTTVGDVIFTRTAGSTISIPAGTTATRNRASSSFALANSTGPWAVEGGTTTVAVPGGNLTLRTRYGAWNGSGGTSSQGMHMTYVILENNAPYEVTFTTSQTNPGGGWYRWERGGLADIRTSDRTVFADGTGGNIQVVGFTSAAAASSGVTRSIAAGGRIIVATAGSGSSLNSQGSSIEDVASGDFGRKASGTFQGINLSLTSITGSGTPYDYSVSRSNSSGPATLTHFNGINIPDITIEKTSAVIDTDVFDTTPNVQGTYTVASASTLPQTTPALALTTTGIGEYPITQDDSPSIQLRLAHSTPGSSDYFVAETEPFSNSDIDTPAEFATELVTRLRQIPQFGAVSLTDTENRQAYYFVHLNDSEDGVLIQRTVQGDIALDTDIFTVNAFTRHLDSEYPETHFGGDISIGLTVVQQGSDTDNTPPTVRIRHPEVGDVNVILFGTYNNDTDVATSIRRGYSGVTTHTMTQQGSNLTITRNAAGEVPSDYISTYSVVDDPSSLLEDTEIAAVQTRVGLDPAMIEPVIDIQLPDGSIAYTVDLDGVGSPDSDITSVEIANAIRTNFNNAPGWGVSGSDSEIVFTHAGRMPIVGNWSWAVTNYGDTGTQPSDLPQMRQWSKTVAGQSAIYSRPTRVKVEIHTGYNDDGSPIREVFYERLFGSGPGILKIPANQRGQNTPIIVDEAAYADMWWDPDSDSDMRPNGDTESLAPAITDLLGLVRGSRRLELISSDDTTTLTVSPTQYSQLANFLASVAVYGDELANNIELDTEVSVYFRQSTIAPDPYIDTDTDYASTSIAGTSVNTYFDAVRPWAADQVNPNREFPVFIQSGNIRPNDNSSPRFQRIRAADIGYLWGTDTYNSYVEREQLGLTPEFNTEQLQAVALWADGGSTTVFGDTDDRATLRILSAGTSYPGENVDLTDTEISTANNFIIGSDYKVDLRVQGRFINFRIEDNKSPTAWNISGGQFEIGKGGKR